LSAENRDRYLWNGEIKGTPRCPTCTAKLNGFTAGLTGPGAPRDGDLSICIYCAQLLQYQARPDGGFTFTGVTIEEIRGLDSDAAATMEELLPFIEQVRREASVYICTACGWVNRRAKDVRRRRCQGCHRYGASA
jgi:hypothetical protein